MQRLLLFLLYVVSLPCLADPGLYLDVDKTEVELGKRINAILYGVDASVDPKQLDLTQFRGQFSVEIPGTTDEVEDKRWPDSRIERLRLRFTPKTTGELTLPAIIVGELETQPVPVSVRKGMVKDKPIDFSTSLSPSNPWERQQVILWAEIVTPEPFARLTLDPWQPQGFETVPLPFVREKEGERYRIGIGWALFPLVAGEHRLEIPPVSYRVSGSTRRRYYFSDEPLEVKELPPYILPTTPVGRLMLSSRIDPSGILESGVLANWHLHLEGAELTPLRFPPIQRQIESSDNVEFLPENLIREINPDSTGVHGSVRMTYPFKPAGTGLLGLPSLRMDYFDPDTGRLETMTFRHEHTFVYHRGMLFLVLAVLLLAISQVVLRWSPSLLKRYRKSRARRALLSEMASVESPVELRNRLDELASIEGWGSNLTLRQWGRYWKAKSRAENENLDLVLDELERACYASPEARQEVLSGFSANREKLLGIIRSRRGFIPAR
ncbi:MAG: hypothetical protein P8Z33_06765 [Gammaproteobacteria bacterium]|jgi:hypothetical protein